MLRYISALVACLALLLSSSSGFAAPKKKKKPAKAKTEEHAAEGEEGAGAGDGKKYPYGMAGCGLGSVVIKTDSKGPQIGAAFLNLIGFQCTAISSTGSSNCNVGPDKEMAATEQDVFISANLAELSRDAAQGGGEHLNALAEVMGCDVDNDGAQFAKMSQTKYSQIFTSSDAKVVWKNYLVAIHADDVLSDSCTRANLDVSQQVAVTK